MEINLLKLKKQKAKDSLTKDPLLNNKLLIRNSGKNGPRITFEDLVPVLSVSFFPSLPTLTPFSWEPSTALPLARFGVLTICDQEPHFGL